MPQTSLNPTKNKTALNHAESYRHTLGKFHFTPNRLMKAPLACVTAQAKGDLQSAFDHYVWFPNEDFLPWYFQCIRWVGTLQSDPCLYKLKVMFIESTIQHSKYDSLSGLLLGLSLYDFVTLLQGQSGSCPVFYLKMPVDCTKSICFPFSSLRLFRAAHFLGICFQWLCCLGRKHAYSSPYYICRACSYLYLICS